MSRAWRSRIPIIDLEGKPEQALRGARERVRPGDEQSMTDDLIQAFVSTDVAFSGLATLGQAIELQAQQIVTS